MNINDSINGASQLVLVIKNPPTNAGGLRDTGSIPGLGRSPGVGHGIPYQYSKVEHPMDRGAWWTTIHLVEKSRTQLKPIRTHDTISKGI